MSHEKRSRAVSAIFRDVSGNARFVGKYCADTLWAGTVGAIGAVVVLVASPASATDQPLFAVVPERSSEAPGHAQQAQADILRPDASIRRDVLSALAQARTVDYRKIKVFVSRGVVTLRGTLRSAAQKARAEEAAAKVVGVRLVINQIEIGGGALNRT